MQGKPATTTKNLMVSDIAMDLLKEWMSVAESGVCSLEVLSEQLPVVNQLLETSMNSLNDDFRLLSESAYNHQKRLDILLESQKSQSPEEVTIPRAIFEEMQQENEDVRDAIGRMVVGMQFQDRVSQNLVITIDVIHFLVAYIKKSIKHTAEQLKVEDEKAKIDEDFAKQLIEQLKLGELQTRYTNHLIKHGYIQDASEVGYKTEEHGDDGEDIELF